MEAVRVKEYAYFECDHCNGDITEKDMLIITLGNGMQYHSCDNGLCRESVLNDIKPPFEIKHKSKGE